ncbi:MAG: calcium-binding protein, partial [Synechococcaceae cyanobacterium]|nr:calcium-binding protein [Synechococcaceae cyanobacterium]
DLDAQNRFLYGHYVDGKLVEPGLWDDISLRFVQGAEGEVITFTAQAQLDRIFARTELPALLANPRVTSIDGIPRELLAALPLENGMPVQAFHAIRTMSAVRSALLGIPIDPSGAPRVAPGTLKLDPQAFIEGLPGVLAREAPADVSFRPLGAFLPTSSIQDYRQGLDVLTRLRIDVGAALGKTPALSPAPLAPWLQGSFAHLSHAADVVGLGLVAWEARQRLDQGDREGAQTLLSRWALEQAGAIVGGRLGLLLSAPLLAAGPLGMLLAAGLTIGASHLGSLYADEVLALLVNGLAALSDQTLSRLRQLFATAEANISPLVLDLDGDGVTTLAITDGLRWFDHDGNRFAERSGWVGHRDGLLVRDLDGNGLIESGRELFGNHTLLRSGLRAAHGFEALADLDSDRDGRITASDAAWSSLAIWRDADGSASTAPSELHSLASLGIAALPVQFQTASLSDPQGNIHRQIGAFQRADGRIAAMHDVWFTVDHARSRDLAAPINDPLLARLPDISGSGVVPSLRQAIARDGSGRLASLLHQWTIAGSSQRPALLDALILTWTGVSQVHTSSLPLADGPARRAAVERLLGQTYRDGQAYRNPSAYGLQLLEQAWQQVRTFVSTTLAAQIELPLLLQGIRRERGAVPSEPRLDAEQAARWIQQEYRLERDGFTLEALRNALNLLPDQGRAVRQALRQIWIRQPQADALACLLFPAGSLIVGTALADQLGDTLSADGLFGADGHDILRSDAGDDVHRGGRGNDTIHSGAGHDLFVFAAGDGIDRVQDFDGSLSSRDRLQFSDLLPSQLAAVLRSSSGDLVLRFVNGDEVTMANHFASPHFRLEELLFADGSLWGEAQILARSTFAI